MTAKKQKKGVARGLSRFMIADGQGGWREMTHRDFCVMNIGLRYAANGLDFPPEERARAAAAAYDEAAAELPAPRLDRAA